jgi:hypothetical protein
MFGNIFVAIAYMPQRPGARIPEAIQDRSLRAFNISHNPRSDNDSQIRMGNFPLFRVVNDVSR